MVRILAVANHVGALGGLERTQLTMCRALAARGHRVDLVYQSEGDFAQDWRAFTGTMAQIGRSFPTSLAPVASSLEAVRAVGQARQLNPDVIYAFRPLDIPLAVGAGLPSCSTCACPVPVCCRFWCDTHCRTWP
jgi:hypothetical protein